MEILILTQIFNPKYMMKQYVLFSAWIFVDNGN
jgi:hypothetical protein